LQNLSNDPTHWMTSGVLLDRLEKMQQGPQLQVSLHFGPKIYKHYTMGGRHPSPAQFKAGNDLRT
jgi:hypothetical protein